MEANSWKIFFTHEKNGGKFVKIFFTHKNGTKFLKIFCTHISPLGPTWGPSGWAHVGPTWAHPWKNWGQFPENIFHPWKKLRQIPENIFHPWKNWRQIWDPKKSKNQKFSKSKSVLPNCRRGFFMPEKKRPRPIWGPPGQFFPQAGKIPKLHKFCLFSLVVYPPLSRSSC